MPAFNEKDWQAESDARTLAEAERIKSDPRRFQSAKSKIDVQVQKLEEEKQAFLKVAAKDAPNSRSGLLSRPVKK